jgi:hypothetical protein
MSKLHFCLNDNDDDNTSFQNANVTHSRMTITPVGNVGIGTTTPAQKLDVNGDAKISGTLDMASHLITNVTTPSAGTDAANKAYVDAVAQGLSPKQSVRAATTVAGTLASSFEDGDTIDGVTLATNDRILIKDQADANENGIYIVQASGAPVRAADFNAPADNVAGAYVFVQEGTANADSGWVCTTNEVVDFGTSDFDFTQFSSAGSVSAGTNITVSGTQVSVVAAPSFAGNVTANSAEASSSTTTGALRVSGGAGITGNLFIGGTGNVAGILSATSGTGSTSTTSGALQVTGGVGISQNLFVGGTGNVAGILSATSGTGSTSTTSGALQVTGGTGISQNLFVGGTGNVAGILSATSADESSSTTTGALQVTGGAGITGNLNVGGTLSVASMTTTPTISSITAIANCTGISTSNILRKKLLKINSERILSLVISVEPTAVTTTTSFRFPLPDITEFTTLDQLVPSVYGLSTESSPMINVENCVIYPHDIVDPETNEIVVSFTSSATSSDTVLLYINITYTAI